MTKSEPTFSPFSPKYKKACLALFDQNCPRYFSPNEKADYKMFLSGKPAGYSVGFLGKEVVAACGLTSITELGQARLSWILVSNHHKGQGLGHTMMTHMLEQAKQNKVQRIDIAASHLSADFFAKFGAKEILRTENGWGPEMRRVDMLLQL